MATASRRPAPPLKGWVEEPDTGPHPDLPVAERLFSEGYAFDFFQAVRLLERLHPERRPVGGEAPPRAEVVRFRAHSSLSFPPSTIHQIEAATRELPTPAMTVAFLGLTGPSGVLPRHYSELLYAAQRNVHDPERFVVRDWLDQFNHRLISLFYRAWAKYRFWLHYERGEATGAEPDPFTRCLFSLIGLGTPALRNRLRVSSWEASDGRGRERLLARVDDQALLYYGGLLAHRPRCAVSLEALLEDYYGLPVSVQQFQGQWLHLDPGNRSRLAPEGWNNELGVNAVAGARVWDLESKIRIRLGPLGYEQFLDWLPDRSPVPEGKTFFGLLHLVRFYVGPALDVDVQLVLKGEEVPECRLPESTADGPRLGWNTWVRSQSMVRDPEDAVFEGEEIVWVNEEAFALAS